MIDPTDPTLSPSEVAAAIEAERDRSKALRRQALSALQWPDHTCPDLDAAKRLLRRQANRRSRGQPVEAEALAEARVRLDRVHEAQARLAAIASTFTERRARGLWPSAEPE